jgi:hypothetical protein
MHGTVTKYGTIEGETVGESDTKKGFGGGTGATPPVGARVCESEDAVKRSKKALLEFYRFEIGFTPPRILV